MYVCVQVLPPLRDVKNKPEVGNALRNKLVRLMTYIDTDVKDCAAEFLFVLCKESGEENSWSIVQVADDWTSILYELNLKSLSTNHVEITAPL